MFKLAVKLMATLIRKIIGNGKVEGSCYVNAIEFLKMVK